MAACSTITYASAFLFLEVPMLTQPHLLALLTFKIYSFLSHQSKHESSGLFKKKKKKKKSSLSLIAQLLLCNIYCSSGDFTNLELFYKFHKYTIYSSLDPAVNSMRKEYRFGVPDIYSNSEGGKQRQ